MAGAATQAKRCAKIYRVFHKMRLFQKYPFSGFSNHAFPNALIFAHLLAYAAALAILI